MHSEAISPSFDYTIPHHPVWVHPLEEISVRNPLGPLLPPAQDWGEFNPRAYLQEYYSDLGAENSALLQFYVDAYKAIPHNCSLLDFGGGPTIYPLIGAANKVKEIHVCDYLPANLAEVLKWLRRKKVAFNWKPFISATLKLENGRPCTPSDIAEREEKMRKRITRLSRCDARFDPPLHGPVQKYDIVISNFCAESATDDRQQWRTFLRNIASLLRPGGKFIISALKGAHSYPVGRKIFPAVSINEADLAWGLITAGCKPESLDIRSVPADRPTRYYDGLMLAVAEKR
jgi:SAM-dependent methyltransferase